MYVEFLNKVKNEHWILHSNSSLFAIVEGGWIEDRSVEPTELIATERSAVV